jgi:hypothetical protein
MTTIRLSVMCDLTHTTAQTRQFEAARILADLSEQIRTGGIEFGKAIVLNDVHGRRIGVCDLFGKEHEPPAPPPAPPAPPAPAPVQDTTTVQVVAATPDCDTTSSSAGSASDCGGSSD